MTIKTEIEEKTASLPYVRFCGLFAGAIQHTRAYSFSSVTHAIILCP